MGYFAPSLAFGIGVHSSVESPLASTAVAPGDCVFHAENEGRRHAPRRHFAPPVYRFHCGGPVSWILVSADAPKSAASEQQQQEYDDEHAAEHRPGRAQRPRSEEHTSELQSLMRISYAVLC